MMRRKLYRWATLCALIFLCGAQARAQGLTIRGRLAHTVEAGGWLLVTQQEKYLLLNADRWRGESWFRADAEVEATGEVRADAVTIYMEGKAFEARTLRPFGAGAQTTEVVAGAPAQLTRVVVTGDALIQAQPDTAIVTVAVVTQGRTALAAQ